MTTNIWIDLKAFYGIGGTEFFGSVNGESGMYVGWLDIRDTGRLNFSLLVRTNHKMKARVKRNLPAGVLIGTMFMLRNVMRLDF